MTRDLPVQSLRADTELARQLAPMALGGQATVPADPGRQTSADCFQRQDFSVQPGSLNFMRQVSRPDFRGTGIVFEATLKRRARNAPGDGRCLGTGITVINVRIDRSLRKHRSHVRALEDQRGAVFLVPDKMDDAAADKVHELNRIAQMKNGYPCSEAAFVSGHALEQR